MICKFYRDKKLVDTQDLENPQQFERVRYTDRHRIFEGQPLAESWVEVFRVYCHYDTHIVYESLARDIPKWIRDWWVELDEQKRQNRIDSALHKLIK